MNHLTFDYSGTTVLVTGGTSGIGHAIATAFADAGAAVTVTGTRPTAAEYDVELGQFSYRHLQMTDPASIDSVSASFDRLDVLVNNAGANFPGGRDEWEPDTFATAIELNLTGPMRLTTSCRDLLRASSAVGGGAVVNIASMAAFRATPIVPGYASAKAGLVALTRNLAQQWATDPIRVNAVAPGVIETPMTAPLASFPSLRDPEIAHTPLGRFGTTDEVASAVLFLASAGASYITGATLAVDGGYLTV